MEFEIDVKQIVEELVAAISSESNDWSHYQWQNDCKSVPSDSTATLVVSPSNSCAWSSCTSSESSNESDVEIVTGKAAANPGRWKRVKDENQPEFKSKPAEWPVSNWTISMEEPLLVMEAVSDFADSECYTKGVKWAPDGSCFLSAANDNYIRAYNLPEFYCRSEMAVTSSPEEMKPAFSVNEGDLIYDYCWYPFMDSSKPETCFKDHPVHLRDAFTGKLVASYSARNQVDVLISPFAIQGCRLSGQRFFAGYNRQIRVFDFQRLGPNSLLTRSTTEKTFGDQGQTSLISCFAQEPTAGNILAAGCYDKSIGLYGGDELLQFSCMTAHRAGVTQVLFNPNGNYLYSGARKDGDIICWDIRRPGHVVAAYRRVLTTNQRMQFDIIENGTYMIAGGSDGSVSIFDLKAPFKSCENQPKSFFPIVEHKFSFHPHQDCVNGISFNPSLPLLLTSSGQRWFDMKKLICSESDEEDSVSSNSEGDNSEYYIPRSSAYAKKIKQDNSIKLWQFDAAAL